MTACSFCGGPTEFDADHPCCEWWRSQGNKVCPACIESQSAERRHQQRGGTCQCREHQERRERRRVAA